MKQPYLSVVIPTYNEQKRIIDTIDQVEKYFKKRKILGEIIVSDDSSRDKTVDKVKAIRNKYRNIKVLSSGKNYHKGWPVKIGMLAALGQYVLFTDADLATPIVEADKLLAAVKNGADVVIGSRIQPGGIDLRESQPLYRRLLGKIFTRLMNILIPNIADSQCGFKLFTRKATTDLFSRQKIENIIFDVEILYLARKLGYKIVQMPVVWHYSGETRMKVNANNASSTVFSLFKIWLWHH